MAREVRDGAWATTMETRLAALITEHGRKPYRIRALECRRSSCAMEVASDVDYPRVSLIADDVLDRELRWTGETFIALEDDSATGTRTSVTVAMWRARSR